MSIESVLSLVGVTGTPQRVLLELLGSGPQTAAFLAKKLSLPRPSIYDALHLLEEKSLVVSQEENGKSLFSANHPNKVTELIIAGEDKLSTAKKEFSVLIPELIKSPRITERKIQMFSGREGCQQTMRDILWHKNIETYALWPMNRMIEVLTPDFLEWRLKKRVENNINVKSMRKSDDRENIKKYPFLGPKPGNLRQVRFLPKKIDFTMSYWIYADNVAFVSAGKELYGFIVHSKEFAEMMEIHFNLLWEQAKE